MAMKLQQSAAFFPVFRTHRTAVRLHDGHTYRQADAHIAPLVGDLLLIAGEIALEQVRQKLLLDAAAVVRDLENSKAVGVVLPCWTAFSIRLISTCSMRMISIGIISSVSGAVMLTSTAG